MKLIIAALLLLFASGSAPAQSATATVSLQLKDIRGKRLSLADYKGKVVLINFWATWCVPCRTEIPDLVKWQRSYRERGLRVIGVTYPPQTIGEVRRFSRKFKINYRVALGTRAIKSLFTESETLPMTVIIDKTGRMHGLIEGIIYSEEFDEKVKPLVVH